MTTKSIMDLPEDYAIVLRQVKESGEEYFISLREILNLSYSRLAHIIQSLRRKGLLIVKRVAYDDMIIKLSAKGQKKTTYIWPELAVIS